MAELSNVYKYTIRHEKEAEGTEVEIPVYPTSVTTPHNLISKSWNNAWGEFKDIPINSKLKINWVYDCIPEDKLEILFGTLIYNKILLYKSRIFYINSFYPGLGYVKGKFYLGSPTNISSLAGFDGSVSLSKTEIHWIEQDGIILNKPTDIL